MQAGDMVYYLYTDKNGTQIKFAAVVLGLVAEGISIRVGRFDVHSKQCCCVGDALQPLYSRMMIIIIMLVSMLFLFDVVALQSYYR